MMRSQETTPTARPSPEPDQTTDHPVHVPGITQCIYQVEQCIIILDQFVKYGIEACILSHDMNYFYQGLNGI